MKPKVYVETSVLGYLTSWSQKTMSDDPIVGEIRRVRHAHAEQFNNDLSAIVADIRRLERESGRSYVNLPPSAPEEPPSQSAQKPPPPTST